MLMCIFLCFVYVDAYDLKFRMKDFMLKATFSDEYLALYGREVYIFALNSYL